MAVHQCARFLNNPRLVHKRVVSSTNKYLTITSTHVYFPDGNKRLTTRGTVYRPDTEKGIKCYVDTEFSDGWDQSDADNVENVISRTGYVITYEGCPSSWCSKLQTKIDLSITIA